MRGMRGLRTPIDELGLGCRLALLGSGMIHVRKARQGGCNRFSHNKGCFGYS